MFLPHLPAYLEQARWRERIWLRFTYPVGIQAFFETGSRIEVERVTAALFVEWAHLY